MIVLACLTVVLAALVYVWLHLEASGEADKATKMWERYREQDNVIRIPETPARGLDSAATSQAFRNQKLDPTHEAKVLRLQARMGTKRPTNGDKD